MTMEKKEKRHFRRRFVARGPDSISVPSGRSAVSAFAFRPDTYPDSLTIPIECRPTRLRWWQQAEKKSRDAGSSGKDLSTLSSRNPNPRPLDGARVYPLAKDSLYRRNCCVSPAIGSDSLWDCFLISGLDSTKRLSSNRSALF